MTSTQSWLPALAGASMLAIAGPSVADLRAANDFVLLSAREPMVLGDRVTVAPVVAPNWPICPGGAGCKVRYGAVTVTRGQDDRIEADETAVVAEAATDAGAFAEQLRQLSPTRTVPALTVPASATVVVTTTPGLNVIAATSLTVGPGGRLEIHGDAASMVVIDLGAGAGPGSLTLSAGSEVALTGGITPGQVIFNVAGAGAVTLGASARLAGTVLAPDQRFAADSGTSDRPTRIEGAVLAGRGLRLGNDVSVGFTPLQQIGRPVVLAPLRRVDLAKLPPAPKRGGVTESDVFIPAPHIPEPPGRPGAPRKDAKLVVTRARQIDEVPGDPAIADPTLVAPLSFTGVGQNGHIPSDVQLAVGSTAVIEMTNVTGARYAKKTGAIVGSTFDLGQFFLGAVGQGTDPRILFDAPTKTFFAAYESLASGGDSIILALAKDPGTQWTFYLVDQNSTGLLFDQPKLGVGDDKITLSWNEYSTAGGGKTLNGADTIVIQKAGVLAVNNTVPAVIWGPDSSRFQIVPVLSLSSDGGSHYAMYHNSGDSNVHVMTFTGVPGVSNTSYTDQSYGVGSVSGPPSAAQPAGGDSVINTNDDRMLSATWQNNVLWGSFNEGCTPSGDTATHACERFVQVNTGAGSLNQNVTLGSTGQDVYYSAVTLDRAGDLFFGLTFSSTTVDPVAVVLGVPGGSFGSVTGGIAYAPGTRTYVGGGSTFRWGDYVGAARDPSDTKTVWVAIQFGGTGKQGLYGTGITSAAFH